MLKVNADTQGKDYLDYIVPFVCYVLEKNRPRRITDVATQNFLKEEFGLNLPVQAVGLVLRRLAKRRVLKRDSNTFTISGPIPVGKTDERRATARRQQKVVAFFSGMPQHLCVRHFPSKRPHRTREKAIYSWCVHRPLLRIGACRL
jgi:hypothetical protein